MTKMKLEEERACCDYRLDGKGRETQSSCLATAQTLSLLGLKKELMQLYISWGRDMCLISDAPKHILIMQ